MSNFIVPSSTAPLENLVVASVICTVLDACWLLGCAYFGYTLTYILLSSTGSTIIGVYLGREIAHAEHRRYHPLQANGRWYRGLYFWQWSKSSKQNFLFPTVGIIVLTLVAWSLAEISFRYMT